MENNTILDSFLINSEIIDVSTFLNLNEEQKEEFKNTEIVMPSDDYPFGAIKVNYSIPKYKCNV
jgi:hypothetical protein